MPVTIRVDLTGGKEALERLAAAEERIRHPAPALEVIADLFELHVAAQFTTQGKRGGQPWAPLAPSTVRARTKRWGYYRQPPAFGAGPAGPINTWTGRARGSFARGHPEHIRDVSDTELTWGSTTPHVVHLQRGPRPPIAFRDDFQQRELVERPLSLWLQGVPVSSIRSVMVSRLR